MAQIKSIYGNEFVDKFARENMITKPTTAQVGQMLVVKAVDENGVPTEWDVENVASGGSDDSVITVIDVTTTEEITAFTTTLNTEQFTAIRDCKEMLFKLVLQRSPNATGTALGTVTGGFYHSSGSLIFPLTDAAMKCIPVDGVSYVQYGAHFMYLDKKLGDEMYFKLFGVANHNQSPGSTYSYSPKSISDSMTTDLRLTFSQPIGVGSTIRLYVR